MHGLLLLAAAGLAGCEELAYEVQEQPEFVRMLGKREVTIMDLRF